MKRTYPNDVPAIPVCRAALQQGALFRERRGWRFGRRLFRFHTVNALIDSGEAVRVGEHVVRWSVQP